MKVFAKRILWLIILFIGATALPWYMVLGVSFISGFFFDNFFEIIAVGIFYDVLFYIPSFHWYQLIAHTAIAVILFAVTFAVTKVTRKPKLFI